MIFDAHLDLSYNALDYNRDLRRPVVEIRESEVGMSDRGGRGRGTVAFPEMRKGGVGLCVGTLLAPCWRPENPIGGWRSAEQGWAQVKGQLSWYQAMEECGELEIVTGVKGLDRGGKDAIGMVLSLEGADPVLSMRHLEALYEAGLRAVGPAHYGAGIYANGTDGAGGLNECGRELLREMEQLGIILDVTHLCDDSFWEAVEVFDGPVWASHSNCRELVDHNRQFSDEQLKYLIGRGAVIGSAMDAWMLVPGWERGGDDAGGGGSGVGAGGGEYRPRLPAGGECAALGDWE